MDTVSGGIAALGQGLFEREGPREAAPSRAV
nr:MAG TPA: hypothetical protein [Caudoviricetes sp.]